MELEPLRVRGNEWSALFRRFDHDGDGRVTREELDRMLSERNVSGDTIRRMHAAFDEDGNGFLEEHEFLKMVQHKEYAEIFRGYVNKYVLSVVPQRRATAARGRSADIEDGAKSFEAEYSCWPPPVAMLTFSIVEIVLFAIDYSISGDPHASGPISEVLMYNPWKRFEAWRFLTYMFVHSGHTHITVNVIVQIMLGIPLEMVHRSWRITVVYSCGVVAGSLMTSITDPKVFLAGASGGVYSLLTAHIASVIMNWKEMEFALIQLLLFLCITTMDFGSAVYTRYFLEEKNNIGYAAHLAGALAGLFVGIFVLRNLEQNSCEKKLWWVSLIAFALLMATAIIWNAAFPSYFPPLQW